MRRGLLFFLPPLFSIYHNQGRRGKEHPAHQHHLVLQLTTTFLSKDKSIASQQGKRLSELWRIFCQVFRRMETTSFTHAHTHTHEEEDDDDGNFEAEKIRMKLTGSCNTNRFFPTLRINLFAKFHFFTIHETAKSIGLDGSLQQRYIVVACVC